MEICRYCGDEIEFRYVGGVVTPIHINGGGCSSRTSASDSSGDRLRREYNTYKSYLDPNARCPVCGALVFFYQSPFGGRVFFDDVGWPWPKHPHTENWSGRDDEIGKAPYILRTGFKSAAGEPLSVVMIRKTEFYDENRLQVWCANTNASAFESRRVLIETQVSAMNRGGISIEDLKNAPAFVIPRDGVGVVEFTFICGRQERIVALPIKVLRRE